MRMTFRQFLEAGVAPFKAAPSVTGHIFNTGPFAFPDLSYLHMPGETPPGGFQSFQAMVQGGLDRQSYYTNQTLQQIATMATNIYQNVHAKTIGQPTTDNFHPHAQFDPTTNLLYGLDPTEFEGTGRWRIQPQQAAIAREMGILVDDPHTSGMIAIDISNLKAAMLKAREKMKKAKYGMHQAGKFDQAITSMMSGGAVPLSKAANPFQ